MRHPGGCCGQVGSNRALVTCGTIFRATLGVGKSPLREKVLSYSLKGEAGKRNSLFPPTNKILKDVDVEIQKYVPVI